MEKLEEKELIPYLAEGEIVDELPPVENKSKRNQKDKHHIDVVCSDSLYEFITRFKEEHKDLTSYNATVRYLLEIGRTLYEELPNHAILVAVLKEEIPDPDHPGEYKDFSDWRMPKSVLFR